MGRIQRRESAKRDLIEQFVWYAENAGMEVADRFLISASRTLEYLAAAPQSGIPVLVQHEELKGMRRWPVKDFGKILFFYFPLPDGVDLVRMIHGSRDLAEMFEDGFLD